MAEFLNQKVEPEMTGMNRLGKPLSEAARQAAYEHCKRMDLTSARAWECVGGMAEQLERDKPYEAIQTGCRFLDITGAYRVMAVLLTVGYE